MISTEFGNFVSYGEVKKAWGVDEEKLDRLLKDMKPPVSPQYVYGEKCISHEFYREIEAEWLKHCHKKTTIRQAIGLIAIWDCVLNNDPDNERIAKEWSRHLGRKITGNEMCELIHRFVAMREALNMKYRRPDDSDFEQIAGRWSDKLQYRINAEDAELLLGIYVQGKDFFEPLPRVCNNA